MSPIMLVVATAAVLGLGIGAEWMARTLLRRSRYRLHPPGTRRVVYPDPETHPQLEPRLEIEFNSDGERGRPLPRSWNRTARVVVVGGSAAECFTAGQQTCWPGVLERRLQELGWAASTGADDVYVGTLARSGVDTATLRNILHAVLPQYERLDAVVVMVGGSDILHWLGDGASRFRVSDPMPISGIFIEHPEMQYGLRLRHLALTEVIRRVRTRLRRRPKVDRNAARWMGRARAMRQQAREIRRELPDPQVMLAAAETHMRDILALAQAAAPRVLVVRQPWFDKVHPSPDEEALFWSGSVGSAFRGFVDVFYSHEVVVRLMAMLDDRIARVCEEMGVPSMDVRPRLEMSARCFIDQFHLTTEGCRRVGDAVARRLQEVVDTPLPQKNRMIEKRAVSPRMPI